jgi:tetratricopeptide (TPR) repeat protein
MTQSIGGFRRSVRLTAAALAIAAAFGAQLTPQGELRWSTAQAQEQVRAEIGRPLQAARDLIKQQKYKEALAKLKEAEAVPNRTAHENLLIEQMRASAAMQAGDLATASKATQALLSSGKLSAADQGRFAAGLASLYYREKNYAEAAAWAQKATAVNPGDKTMRGLMIQSYYLAGDTAAAQREALADVQAAEKAGQAPPEDRLQLLANIASKGTDKQAYIGSLEKLVAYYPKKEYWNDLLRRIEAKPGFNNRLALDMYRLRRATKTLDSGNDVFEMAQLALQERQAAEAKKVLEEGFASGLLGKGSDAERQKRLLNLANQKAEEAPKTLAASEAEAVEQKDGGALVRIGMAYSGMGQYDKGIQLIQQGIALLQQDKGAKGKAGRVDEANLHLGIAYLRAGQKQKAAQAFKSVQGTDGSADLARLWTRLS